jgi:hypothetical protein
MNRVLRIAAIGNQNNNHFSLVRYLRDVGFSIDLLLLSDEQDHFHPKCDTYDLAYVDYIKKVHFGAVRGFSRLSSSEINNYFAEYDVLIGTGLAPAILDRANRILDIFDPYGADLWDQTFYRFTSPQLLLDYNLSVFHQRRGIRSSRIIHAGPMDRRYEDRLMKFSNNERRWFDYMPMVYHPQYEELFNGRHTCTHWQQEFTQIRKSHDLVIIFAARNNWSSETDQNTKGIDIFLHGYNKFVLNNLGLSCIAVFTEYGKDVDRAKSEARLLGLHNKVVWLPAMYRKDLMFGLHLADICCGQFSISWISNGTLFEALVAGKPILTWRDPELYGNVDDLYPIYNAKNSDDIATCLQEFINNPDRGRKIGLEGQSWYRDNVVYKTINRYARFFDQRATELGKNVV